MIKRREVTSGITRTGQFMGSVDYVAPEQVRGEPVDGRADVYSLGCVLYESLTGHPPFASDLEVTVLYAQLEEPPPLVTGPRPELPPGIDAVVSRAMAKRPEDRFATAGAMATATRDALGPRQDAPPPHAEPPPRRGGLLAAGAVAVAVAAVIVASAMLLGRGGVTTPAATQSSHTPVAPPASGIVRIDPVTGRATAFAPPPGSDISYTGLVAGEGALWAASPNGVTHIDPRSGNVVKLIPTEDTPVNVAIGDGSVWAAGDPGDWHLWRIDPATDQQGGSINLIARGNFSTVQTVYRVSTGFGAVWVADQTCGCVLRVDPARARVRKVIGIGGADAIAAGGGGVWVVDNFHQELVRIDPRNNEVAARVPLELGSPDLVAVGMGAVWVADGGSGTLVEVDPLSNQVVSPPIGIGGGIADLAVGAGAVWVSHGRGQVARVDPVSYSVTSVRIPGPGVDDAGHLAIDEPNHLVWLTRCLPGSTVC